MASLSIQFYATIDEIFDCAKLWMDRERLHSAAVEYYPFRVYSIGAAGLESVMRNEQTCRLLLSDRAIEYDVLGNIQLIERNPGALVIGIGRLEPTGLAESHLSAMGTSSCWKRIIKDVKRITAAGMIGTHDRSGATANYRTARYSVGAAELHRLGTPLRPFNGSPVQMHPIT